MKYKQKKCWWKEPNQMYIARCPAWPYDEKKWQLSDKAILAIILVVVTGIVALAWVLS